LLDAGEPVDLLVSDLAMPGMDGLTLIRAAQSRRPALPAILLTGYAGAAASLAIGDTLRGTFSLLRKPISGSQLVDQVATLLEAATSS
jgi:CheY-like chemotaxis protein